MKVPPEHTSRDCSVCGLRNKPPPDERVYKCVNCGYRADVDTNAALNILRLGQVILSSSSSGSGNDRRSTAGEGDTTDPSRSLNAKSPERKLLAPGGTVLAT
ncbi:MAG: hypothetical protein DLM69_00370 [Candidatus Chloroheliales bacterium]|nr:MAG: hypothetical protein DLM69_00370 [Chloroflexota bacterium]